MRKKMKEEDKKISFGISLDPGLLKIIKEYTTENNLKVSQFIESILKEKIINKNMGKIIKKQNLGSILDEHEKLPDCIIEEQRKIRERLNKKIIVKDTLSDIYNKYIKK